MDWVKNIFISVNNAYGDPFTDLQIVDTYDKVNALINDDLHFGVCTKAVPSIMSKELINEIAKLNTQNMFLQYTLTGLNEGGFSFEDRVRTIEYLYEKFGQITILARPIITNENDSVENIERIIKVASSTSKQISFAGLHSESKRKIMDASQKEIILELCYKYGVKNFNKSSCAASNQFKIPCYMHNLGMPGNLDIVKKLGYTYDLIDGKLVIEEGTTGDLNFLRMLTKSNVYTKKLSNNYNILSVTTPDLRVLECTSSWMSWSNNIPCSLACDYCIIKSISYLMKNRKVGCSPKELIDLCDNHVFRRLPSDASISVEYDSETIQNMISYNNIRTVQECECEYQ